MKISLAVKRASSIGIEDGVASPAPFIGIRAMFGEPKEFENAKYLTLQTFQDHFVDSLALQRDTELHPSSSHLHRLYHMENKA